MKIEEDTMKIKKNKEILPKDKLKMLKSARNLSCTINSLIERSKDKLSDYYDSQVRDRSISPGKSSGFHGFKSLRSRTNNSKLDQFNMSNIPLLKFTGNQAKKEEMDNFNTLPHQENSLNKRNHQSKLIESQKLGPEETNKDPLLSSQNNFPSFRADSAFNCKLENSNTSPRFNQSKGGQVFQENIGPNSQRVKSPSSELHEVKKLLYEAMQQIEEK